MGMAASDIAFVSKRTKQVKAGPWIFGACLALLAAVAAWLYVRQPRMINFVEVARQIGDGRLDRLSVELMAVMMPIAMLMCFVLLAAVIALCWLSVANERRYLRIVNELAGQAAQTRV